ncbi:MAG: aldo/keto reductase, partial [Bacteroidales bacterium]
IFGNVFRLNRLDHIPTFSYFSEESKEYSQIEQLILKDRIMKSNKNKSTMNRREFNKSLVTIAAGTPFLIPGDLVPKTLIKPENQDRRNEQPAMSYRKLGRTNFRCSRLVFGCGAALTGGKAVRLLDHAFEAGINYYDCGSETIYKGSEQSFAPFMKANRDHIWVTSKAPIDDSLQDDPVGTEQAKEAARTWTALLDESLKSLQTEYVDAYFLMNIKSWSLISSEEVYNAFLDAKSAGKVGYFGLATHKNANKVLEAAIDNGWYDLAMIGITPAGFYDWSTREIEKDTASLKELQPLLKKARDTGIGLIGMKSVRLLAPMTAGGKADETAFDKYYDKRFLESSLNPFQRAYAYILENGLDVVNADMQNFTHLEENIEAAASSNTYFD